MKTFIKTLIICLFPFAITAQQLEFTQHVVTSSFTKGADVIAVDLDKDGNMDIIGVNSFTSAEIGWWQNNGFNEFTKVIIRDNLNKVRSVRAEDINNDQNIDLVAAVYGENRILYLENNGDETFLEYTVDTNFVGPHTIDIKDVNNDGNLDILCSGFDNNFHNGEIAWWENDGQSPIGWTKHLISDRFQQSPFIYGEDMDGDDDLDVIACGELNGEILWWENDGDQFFTEHMVDSLFNYAHTVIARDVDLDGDMDILGAACMSSKIAWYENNGSQEFIKHTLPYFPGALWLDAIDIDNDGDRDLFGAAQGASTLAWWENDGSQSFTKYNINGGFTQAFCIVPAMMDNDNDTDFVAIGWQSNKISWFENRLEDPNLLNQPESVVYDSENNRYLVSNFEDGCIIQIDSLENQDYFTHGLVHIAGLHIVGNTLFASSYQGPDAGVVGYDLTTADMVFKVKPPGMSMVNDITSDTLGHLYVTEYFGDKIFKIRISDSLCTTFVNSGLNMPNGIIYDPPNNRLLVMNEGWANAPIVAVDLEDSTLTTVVETNINLTDGLTTDNNGNTYISSWATNKTYRYDKTFANPPEVVSSGHSGPADIFFNKLNNILAVPNFNSNSVDFIHITFTGQKENIKNKIYNIKLFPNPFTDIIHFDFYLPEKAHTKIFVWDILGNRIAQLINEELNRGEHSTSWNGTDNNISFKTGIYFIAFNIGNNIKTFKIIKH